MKKRFLLFFVPSLVVALAAVFFGGVVYASSDDGLIHGCVRPITGLLRIAGIGSGTCTSAETPLNWAKKAGNNSLPFVCVSCSYDDSITGGNTFADLLSGKDLTGAYLPSAGLGSDSSSVDMSGTNFTNAYLDAMSPGNYGANFHNVNFTNATVTSVQFTNTVLTNVNFTGSNLTSSSFNGANLTGATGMGSATRTGVTWVNTICPDGTNSNSHINTCEGHF